MAKPAAADRGNAVRLALAALVALTPGRLAFAGRLALVCVLTTVVVQAYGTPSPAVTVYLVFFLNRPDRTTSIVAAIVMVLLISIVIGLLFPLSSAVIDDPPLRVLAMTMTSLVLLFLGSASRLKPFASTIALLTAYVLDLLGSAPGGEFVTRGLLYAWLFVAIPAGLSIFIDLAVAPAPRGLAERALSARLKASAALLNREDEGAKLTFRAMQRAGTAPMLGLVRLAAVERSSTRRDLISLRLAAVSMQTVMACLDLIERSDALSEADRSALAETLLDMAAILDRGGHPISIDPPVFGPAASPEVNAILQTLTDSLRTFAEEPDPALPAPASLGGGFFVPGAFSDPAHVRYALKTTLAAMTCYVAFELLDWPGIHTALITCYIVAQGTAGETVEKLSLRVAGCLVGAAAGVLSIIWIVPAIDDITGLVLLVGAGALIAAWVAAGSARIAYAGFQIAFAFFLCVLQDDAPGLDLAVARDRVVGIFLGIGISHLVATRLWPVSLTSRIDASLASLIASLDRMVLTPAPQRAGIAVQIRAAAAETDGQLVQARYEPTGLRPSTDWLATRETLLAEIDALLSPVLLGVAGARPVVARLAKVWNGGFGEQAPSTSA